MITKIDQTIADNANAARKWQALTKIERIAIQKSHALARSDRRAALGCRPLLEDAWALSIAWRDANRAKWST